MEWQSAISSQSELEGRKSGRMEAGFIGMDLSRISIG